jgi:hypothetical protein
MSGKFAEEPVPGNSIRLRSETSILAFSDLPRSILARRGVRQSLMAIGRAIRRIRFLGRASAARKTEKEGGELSRHL